MTDIVEKLNLVRWQLDHLVAREARNEIERLRKALLIGVCMLSEMGLDPREKCQMAYDYLSATLNEAKQ